MTTQPQARATLAYRNDDPVRLASELPAFDEVLTVVGGAIQLGENDRAQLAVIANRDAGWTRILHTTSGMALPFFGELVKRARSTDLRLNGYILVDASLIRSLNDKPTLTKSDVQGVRRNSVTLSLDDDLAEWVKKKVSDIHIEVREHHEARFRIRINGVLVGAPSRTYEEGKQLVSALYNSMADQTTVDLAFDISRTQKASVERAINGRAIKLRVQTLPAYPGKSFDAIIRIHIDDPNSEPASLRDLGYEDSHCDMLEQMMMLPSGAIVIAGITGSGKTTTLKAMLDYMARSKPYKKYISVESPPEYLMRLVTQISAKDEDKKFMTDIMGALVRADPDVIMMGEVRNAGSGEFLTQMNETGHVMLATVHTDSIFGIPPRLSRLGVDRPTMGYAKYFSGLMCQRLVQTLCAHCKTTVQVDSAASDEAKSKNWRILSATAKALMGGNLKHDAPLEDLVRLRGAGCKSCYGTGWSGRTVCAEMVTPDEDTMSLVAQGRDNDARSFWRSAMMRREDSFDKPNMHGRTMLEHALIKILRGELSPFDVQDEFGPIDYEAMLARKSNALGGAGND